MTEASPVRMATPADAPKILSLCRIAHQEIAPFALDEGFVQDKIDKTTNKQGGIIGVIGDDEIRASICLEITNDWYTREFMLLERWSYVHPDYRKSRYALDLIEFAKECSTGIGIPLVIGITTNQRTEAKVRLFRRALGHPVGALFVFGSKWKSEPTEFWKKPMDERASTRGGKRVRSKRNRSRVIDSVSEGHGDVLRRK